MFRQISKKCRFQYVRSPGASTSNLQMTIGVVSLPPSENLQIRNLAIGYSGSTSQATDATTTTTGRNSFLLNVALGDIKSHYTWLQDTISAFYAVPGGITFGTGGSSTAIASAADLEAYSLMVQDKDYTAAINLLNITDPSSSSGAWVGETMVSRLYSRLSVVGAYSQGMLIPEVNVVKNSNFTHLFFILMCDINTTGSVFPTYGEDLSFTTAGLSQFALGSQCTVNAELVS